MKDMKLFQGSGSLPTDNTYFNLFAYQYLVTTTMLTELAQCACLNVSSSLFPKASIILPGDQEAMGARSSSVLKKKKKLWVWVSSV